MIPMEGDHDGSHPEHRNAFTPSQPAFSDSAEALQKLLSKLAHLDITQYVRRDNAVMKAHGGYCDVFTGSMMHPFRYPVRRKVAIKRLRVHMKTDRDFAKLLVKELHLWSKLDHINILPLIGYVLEGDYPSIVSEWIENGTVSRYLKGNPDTDPTPLITGIANGMEYLHEQDVVHSDLKADNVLVGPSGEPLICDFGISRMLASSLSFDATSTDGLRGSVRWMAFELLDMTGDAHHTKETDVWAFGMTVYEILTREIPYARLRHDVLVMFAIMQGELPSCPDDFDSWSPGLQFTWKICEECWVSPSERRITMEKVASYLRRLNEFDDDAVSLQLPRSSSPTLTEIMGTPVPRLTPDYSSSSSDSYGAGRMSCSPHFLDSGYSYPVTPLPAIEEDPKSDSYRGDAEQDQKYLKYRSEEVDLGRQSPSPNQLLPNKHVLTRNELPIVDKLLQRGSPDLVRFDLRSPVTSAQKLVFGIHWTHLNIHDLSRSAREPPCDSIRLTTRAFSDWIIDVQCVSSGRKAYVSVKDVLTAVQRLFRLAIVPEGENTFLDLDQYRFGGLYATRGRDGSWVFEVDIIHVKPAFDLADSSKYLF